jgi:hypothetical protein
MYKEILELLQKELNLYKQEKKLSKTRLQAFENKDLEKLKEIINLEREIGINIESIEEKRMEKVKQYSLGNLKDIIKELDDEAMKNKFIEVRKDLIDIIEKIKLDNKACEKYIDLNNKMLKELMKSLSGNKEVGYTNKKQKNILNQNNLLNKKI